MELPLFRHKRNRALRQAIGLGLTGLLLWRLFIAVDAFEWLTNLSRHHEAWQLDEVVLALAVCGLCGLVFTLLRLKDLAAEIHQRNQAERDVAWIALHDPLTRLGNRRRLETRLREADTQPVPANLTAFSLDLDGFKKLNDLFGHQAGDEALMEVGYRLRGLFAEEEAELFRLGGDEFLILLRDLSPLETGAMVQRTLNRLSQPYRIGSIQTELGVSLGVARQPEDTQDLRELILFSDLAMYAAKRDPRQQWAIFQPEMNETMLRRHQLELQLRQALKTGEIQPHFQPLVELRSGRVVGFEALARWVGADGRQRSPAEFIPLAEETGLITELSEQLLRQACLAAKQWPADIRLAFNLSPAQLTDKLLGLRILHLLEEVGLPPTRLELEITETALIQDIGQAETLLSELTQAGVHIALDDFGTGYSSLSQLSRFAFDKIKIDRSFIASFEEEQKQEKIVRAIIGLGQGLGLTTTAEGIETPSQLAQLQQLGCDLGQGFLFGQATATARLTPPLDLAHLAGDAPAP